MRNLIYVCLLLNVISCGNTENSDTGKLPQVTSKIDTLEVVEQMRNFKLKIDSLKPVLDSISIDTYETTEGGEVKFFFRSSDTLKKEIIYYGETGKRFIEVYQEDSSPFFIRDNEISYESPIYSSDTISIKDEVVNEYYIKGENLIFWIKNDSVMPSSKYLSQQRNILVNEK